MVSRNKPEAASGHLPDDSVYHQKGNVPAPRFLYVYYIDRHRPPFRAYRFEHAGPIQDIQGAVGDAVREIQRGKSELPQGPDGVVWDVRSYLAFVMTANQGRLIKGDGVRMRHHSTGKNHTFFNGEDLNDVHGCSAMYCLNFRKNRRNDPLGDGESELFRWSANHSTTRKSLLNLSFFFTHTSSGTNLGP